MTSHAATGGRRAVPSAALRDLHHFGTPEGLDLEAVSDACDALGVGRYLPGFHALWQGSPPIAGPIVTMELVCVGFPTTSSHHLGVDAIAAASPGDIIVIDHRGRTDAAGWGGLLSQAAKRAGVSGVVIHGGARDVAEAGAVGLPLWGSAAVSRTARGRVVQRSVQRPIDFAGVAVQPGDVAFVAEGGVVLLPVDHLEMVLRRANEIREREANLARMVTGGADLGAVMGSGYERMLVHVQSESTSHSRAT